MQPTSKRRRGLVAFAVLAAVAETLGHSLTGRVDRALHVAPLAPREADYYPFLLVGVKVAGALALAALLARLVRARSTAAAGNRLLVAVGHGHERRSPQLRASLSPQIWLLGFASTAVAYLLQADAEGGSHGIWSLLAPWLHTYALPVFALLSVLVALAWNLTRWVREVEQYALRTLDRVRRILGGSPVPLARPERPTADRAPRRRFGLAFESRPPPLAL